MLKSTAEVYMEKSCCLVNVQGGLEKLHKVLRTITFEPFSVESHCLHQNAQQRLLYYYYYYYCYKCTDYSDASHKSVAGTLYTNYTQITTNKHINYIYDSSLLEVVTHHQDSTQIKIDDCVPVDERSIFH